GAARRSRQDLSVLRAAIAGLSIARGRASFRLADSQFHGGLAAAAGNLRLETAIHSVRGELFSPHDLLTFVEPVEETIRDHQAILDAVRDRDSDRAAARMTEHVERTRKQLRVIVFG
ncbi:MAG: FCD domain-containing protein, partial [Actinomycetota bacterium]|nr:FCD domain-containing protein [Actinomycetota bacterium]